MDAAEVLANSMQLRMMGGRCNGEEVHSHPPAYSDHHSIILSWQETPDVVPLAQWVFRDQLWSGT
eukprot:1712348-Amphidinium_carterae.1